MIRDGIVFGLALVIGHVFVCPIQLWPAMIRRPVVRDRWPIIAVAVVLGALVRWTVPIALLVALPIAAHAQDAVLAGMQAASIPWGDPGNVSAMQWQVFGVAYDHIAVPINNATGAINAALATVVAPVLRDGLALYLLATIIMSLFSDTGGNFLGAIIKQAIVAGAVMTLIANAGLFDAHVTQPVVTELPNMLTNAIGNTIGGDTAFTGGGPFDALWDKDFVLGLKVYKSLPSLSLKALFLGIIVFVYWFVSIGIIAVLFLMFLGATSLLALTASIATLAIGCAMLPVTRHWFTSWLNTVVGLIVAKVLIIALIALTVVMLQDEMTRIGNVPDSANEVAAIGALLGILAQLAIVAILARQIPNLASSIGHGAWANLSAFSGAAFSAASQTATYAAAFAKGFGQRIGAAAQPAHMRGGSGPNISFSGKAVSGSYYAP